MRWNATYVKVEDDFGDLDGYAFAYVLSIYPLSAHGSHSRNGGRLTEVGSILSRAVFLCAEGEDGSSAELSGQGVETVPDGECRTGVDRRR